jgi:phage terminase large subunit GpA-like protein
MPSDWAQENIVMPQPFAGSLRYEKTPYTREIIDRFSPNDPAREIALMGAAQFGKTASVIVPVIGFIIANCPGNIIATVGHDGLLEEFMDKVDYMLDHSDLRKHIRPSAMRKKNQKTGDTNTIKQFHNGYLKVSSASNPKIWRQSDYKFGLVDDYEAVKGASKVAGNQRDLIQKRFTAYSRTKKILYCSSPELKNNSNILEVYSMGDQRKYMVPCPCCGEYIELKWTVEVKDGIQGGITWKTNEDGSLIPDSVGYTCQSCGGFFTDQNKSEFVNKGFWQPTAKPHRPDFLSYHMNALYSPHGMDSWTDYVYKWLEIYKDGKRNEKKYQTFLNLNLGEPYEETGESPEANQLQRNIRPYEIGIIPERLSQKDGNGKIVLLTCACDLNGKEDDARLDYEVVAWSETGSSYSVVHGSIGTFIPQEGKLKEKVDREHWSYTFTHPKSVWPELDKILTQTFPVDDGERKMKILFTGIDCGHYTNHAYTFIDNKNNPLVIGVRGDKENTLRKFGIDTAKFKQSKERSNLYLVDVNMVKDELSHLMQLEWKDGYFDMQPPNFMNYPTPSNGLYLFKNFFEHYEAEHKIPYVKNGVESGFIWQKKSSSHYNHFWDIRVYNLTLKDILAFVIGREMKKRDLTWSELVDIMLER